MVKKASAFIIAVLAILPLSFAINATGAYYSVDMYASGSQGAIADSANYILRMLMTPFQPSARNALGSLYSANIGFLPSTSAPSIDSASISPAFLANGSTATLSINASMSSSAWAVITLPDSTVVTLPLTNNAGTPFTQTSQIGTYNVTFRANDSAGVIVSRQGSFETFPPVTFNMTLSDQAGSGINSSLALYHNGTLLQQGTSPTGNFSSGTIDALLDLRANAYSGRLQVMLRAINISVDNNKALGMGKGAATGYLIAYSVDNSAGYSFTNATVRIYYDNTSYANESLLSLWKCDPFDFASFTCTGSWANVTGSAIQNTTGHYFELYTTSFSGFAVQQASFCGDGTCNGGETCSSCASDCGACPAPPAPSPSGSNNGGGSVYIAPSQSQPQPNASLNTSANQPANGTPQNQTPAAPANATLAACQPDWSCGTWGACTGGTQSRECTDTSYCPQEIAINTMPATGQSCVEAPANSTLAQNQPAAAAPPVQRSLFERISRFLGASLFADANSPVAALIFGLLGIIGLVAAAIAAALVLRKKK